MFGDMLPAGRVQSPSGAGVHLLLSPVLGEHLTSLELMVPTIRGPTVRPSWAGLKLKQPKSVKRSPAQGQTCHDCLGRGSS